MTDTPVTILINKEEVLTQDASRERRVLDSFVPLLLEKNRNATAVLVTGYDDDQRELFFARPGLQPRRLRFVSGTIMDFTNRCGRVCKIRPAIEALARQFRAYPEFRTFEEKDDFRESPGVQGLPRAI
jgi:hypothetical protein